MLAPKAGNRRLTHLPSWPQSHQDSSAVQPSSAREERLKPPRIPLAINHHTPSNTGAIPRHLESVWTLYAKEYQMKVAGCYMSVVRTANSPGLLYLVHHTSKNDPRFDLDILQKVRSKYMVSYTTVCESESNIDYVFEFMNLSLTQILGAPRVPTEQEVAAIVIQLIKGLQALEHSGYICDQLHPSCVLLNVEGEVKLFPQGLSTVTVWHNPSTVRHAQLVGQIINQLIFRSDHGYSDNTSGNYSTSLMEFISVTSSASSDLDLLLQHTFLSREWHCSDLVPLAWFATTTSKVFVRHYLSDFDPGEP